MDCNDVFQVVDTDGIYNVSKSNMMIPQPESWPSSCLTTPSHIFLIQTCPQDNETCSLYKSDMRMSACYTYKSSYHLSSCKSDVSANSEEILVVTHYSASMENCQDDNFTPISESHSDLHVGFCPGCKIQRLDSLLDVHRTSYVSASSVSAQTFDSSLLPSNVIIEHRATCSVPHFRQDLRACKLVS